MKDNTTSPSAVKQDWKAYALSLESQVKCLEEEKQALLADLSNIKQDSQLLIEKAPTAIYEIDFSGPRFTSVNDAMCQVSEYTREELLKMSPFDLLDEDSKAKFQDRVRKNLLGEPIDPSVEYKVLTKNGRKIYTLLNTTVRFREGKPHSAFVIAQDITERKTAEKELNVAYNQLQSIIDNTPAIVYAFDLEERFTLVNKALAELLNSSPEKMIGKRRHEFMLKEDADWHEANDRRVVEMGTALEFEEHSQLKDRSITWLTAKFPLRNAQGKIVAVAGISSNISERKEVEETMQQKNLMLALLIDAAAELLAGADPIDKLDDFFQRASDALGLEIYVQYNLSEDGTYLQLGRLRGIPDRYLTVLSKLELGQAVCGTVAKIRQPIYVNNVQQQADRMTRLIRKLGIDTYACHPLMVGDRLIGTLSFGSRKCSSFNPETISILKTFCNMVAVSIARKQAETALQDSEALMQAVLDALPVGVSILDIQGGVIQANQAFEKIWGSPIPNVQSVQDYQAYEAWWPDTGVKLSPEEWAAAQAIQQGKTVVGQLLEIKRFDGSRAFVHNSASPVRDSTGSIVGSAVAIQDITHLHETEQLLQETNEHLEQSVAERTQELQHTYERVQALAISLEESLTKERYMRQQLIQSEKYAALTRLVASVAHEINNPLQTIQNCIFLLRKSVPPGEAQDTIDMIDAEGNRMSFLVQQLRETYRPSNLKVEAFNVLDVLSKALNLFSAQFRDNNIELQLKCDQDQARIKGVPDQVNQVFINILLNAVDAMEADGGQLNVAVTKKKSQVRIAFKDSGIGIKKENLEKIFEPFFTTKGKGTGLGLAICYEIIKDHRGTIAVKSTPGNGATFTISLPLLKD